MKKIRLLFSVFLLVFGFASFVLAQGDDNPTPPRSFTPIRELGRTRPQGIQYDPNFDRLVMVDPGGRLVLVDAATWQNEHILYHSGSYSAYTFSHDGRWLAVAIEKRVDIWNTETGEIDLVGNLEDTALALQAPLQFSDDDEMMLVNAIIPAPAAIRRSENDTANLPFLWDLRAARNEAISILPGSYDMYSFYDYLFGLILGPNRKVIGSLPQRYQIRDVSIPEQPILTEVEADRNERDPSQVWFSLRGESMYILPQGHNDLVQINTDTGTQLAIPLGRSLSRPQIEAMNSLVMGDEATLIGAPQSTTTHSFTRLLMGDDDYLRYWSYHPLTVILLDILEPVTVEAAQQGLLVYFRDDQTGESMIDFIYLPDAQALALHPDNVRLAVRRSTGIEIYNLQTGILEQTIDVPGSYDGPNLFAYNGAGDALLADFQRFDAQTGELIYDDPNYTISGFDDYYFTPDGDHLLTITGSEWWVWDILTGEVIRRERIELRGSVQDSSPDAQRYLMRVDTPDGPLMDIVDLGSEQHSSVLIQPLPYVNIEQIVPSPDWQHFLVVYSSDPYSPHYPGNEIAVYNLREGQRWFYAGADLPAPNSRQYGWLDNETIYISSWDDGMRQPERVYGVSYDSSGLPSCLVVTFPYEWRGWLDLWEQLNAYLEPDELDELSQRLCAALPGSVEDVNNVFHPSPTPTLPPMTATPVTIAGVPICLTRRFPSEAQAYASLWREISVGMTPEQLEELEILLCEGLDTAAMIAGREVAQVEEDHTQVMTINIVTGERQVGGFVPTQPTTPARSVQLVLDELYRTDQFRPSDAKLSPDGTRLAARRSYNQIVIFQLNTPYDTLVANATATAAPYQEEDVRYVSIQPTPTQPFSPIGGPRPTLTPTMTPTAPPRPEAVAALSALGQVQNLSYEDQLFAVATPPPGYHPEGMLIVQVVDDSRLWTLDPRTGEMHPDGGTLPDCWYGRACYTSFDLNWMQWQYEGDLVVSRTGGTEIRVLFDEEEGPVWPQRFQWIGLHTLEYIYSGYLPDRHGAISLVQEVDPDSDILPAPYEPLSGFRINELDTEPIASQPNHGSLVVARTSYNAGHGTGYKYYIYDRETQTADFFARLPAGELSIEWHPLGEFLYYRYPDSSIWYVFDPTTRAHRVLGELPHGTWSRDGGMRADWIDYPLDDPYAQERLDAGLPLFKLRLWDSRTGLIRRYTIPESGDGGLQALVWWSPDNRYLLFITHLPDDAAYTNPHTLVLDTETGSVTEISSNVIEIVAWVDRVPER